MSRRNRQKPNIYFDDMEKTRVVHAVGEMHKTVQRIIAPSLTKEEAVTLVYPENLIGDVVWAENYSGSSIWEINWRPRNMKLTLRINRLSTFAPNYQPTFQIGAAPELIARVTDWVDLKEAMHIDYGRLLTVVSAMMNDFTKKEVMYFFPTFSLVLDNAGLTGKLLNIVLEDMRPPRRNKHLSFPLRKAVEKSMSTLASFVLLRDAKYDTSKEVVMTIEPLGSTQYFFEEEGGFTFRRMD